MSGPSVQWGVVYGVAEEGPPWEGAGTRVFDDEAEAREAVQWMRDSVLVSREVVVGPWRREAEVSR